MSSIEAVTDENFHTRVLEAQQVVIVDYWAPWCGPCKQVAPVLEDLAREHPDVQFVKLNIDENPATAASAGVASIPTIVAYRDGQELVRSVGAKPKAALTRALQPAL